MKFWPNFREINNILPLFLQAPQAPKKYYVYNDIFRYQDEVFDDTDSETSSRMNTENDNSFENAENEKNNHRNDGIQTVSILDGVQKPERHLNGDGIGGNGSGTLTPGGNPMAPPSLVSEPPASSSEIEFEEPDPEDASSPKDPAEMPQLGEVPPVTQQTNNPPLAMAAVSPMQVAPPPQPSPVKSAEPGNAPAGAPPSEGAPSVGGEQADTASIESGSTNEKRTYANLFKSSSAAPGGGGAPGNAPPSAGVYPTPGGTSAGGKMVPAGPLSLPGPAFGGKTSQPTSPPVTKEGSPAAGFQGAGSSKPFRGQKGTGGGNRGAPGGGSGQNANLTASGGSAASNMGPPGASRDRYQASRESVSSAAGEDNVSGPPGGPDSIRGGRASGGGGGRMNSLSSYPDSHQVFVGNLPHQCQESHLEDLFSQFGKVRYFFVQFVTFLVNFGQVRL